MLDRTKTHSLYTGEDHVAANPSAPEAPEDGAAAPRRRRSRGRFSGSARSMRHIVRDVSWHSGEPSLMSASWDGPDGNGGSMYGPLRNSPLTRQALRSTYVARAPTHAHLQEWKGLGKSLSLPDAVARAEAEAQEP